MTGDSGGAVEPIETVKPDGLEKWTAAPPRIGKRLHTVGFWITGVWLFLVAAYVIADFTAFKALEPNALGDFAAGAAAPLAFLWLVLGFFQQGEELRHSADALWLQGRELQNSVEQQRELVNVTREQLKFENEVLAAQRDELARNAQPILALKIGRMQQATDRTGNIYDVRLANHGKTCTNLKIDFGSFRSSIDKPVFSTGEIINFRMRVNFGEREQFNLQVSYLDELLNRREQVFPVEIEDGIMIISGSDAD